ncbi:hypothetical protein BLOT_016039 [Blomia tropicalis]|nr:hypothetical protein BLOT_016039 [Blomia tropicalis]
MNQTQHLFELIRNQTSSHEILDDEIEEEEYIDYGSDDDQTEIDSDFIEDDDDQDDEQDAENVEAVPNILTSKNGMVWSQIKSRINIRTRVANIFTEKKGVSELAKEEWTMFA